MADDEVVIHIDDAALAENLGLAATEPKPEAKPDTKADVKVVRAEDDPLVSLKSQFATLKTKSEQTERERDEALRRVSDANARAEENAKIARSAETKVVESQLDTVVSGISAADSEANAAETEYKTAFDTGDATAMAKAQRKMAAAEARKVRLEEAKADLESAQPQAPGGRVVQQEQPRLDPIEAYANGRSEPTKSWLRQHPDWITDQRKNSKLTAAHYDAVGEGIAPDSPEYFEHVETFIGLKEAAKDQPKPETKPARRPSSPAVPVSHSGGGPNGGANEVRLSRAEYEAATDGVTHVWNYDDPSGQKRFKKGDPIGAQEFARRKLAMQREGRYDRSMTES